MVLNLIMETVFYKGARTDIRNNEKKLALDMATNAASASLLKKKQGPGNLSNFLLIWYIFLIRGKYP